MSVNLDRRVGSCNTLNDLSNKVWVPHETEDLNLSIFNVITGINNLKTLTKHMSCKCKCKFDGRKFNSNHKWKISKNKKCKKKKSIIYLKKIIFGILLYVAAKIVNI